jgi:arylsulfatase A
MNSKQLIYHTLFFYLPLFVFLQCTSTQQSAEEQSDATQQTAMPNIVFFLIDDMGYSDVGCYGSDYYETPHIDRLAKNGMLFTQNYAASTVCSPTRASILTGKYPGRVHITHAIPIKGSARLKNTKLLDADYEFNLPLSEFTMAEAFKEKGYATAAIGKWHLAMDTANYPTHQGFDVNIGGNSMGNPGEYFCPYHGHWQMNKESPVFDWHTLPDCEAGEYLTDRLTDEAIDFIENHQESPFFVYLQHYAVHTPLQAKADLIAKYEAKPVDSVKGHTNAKYAAMIESVDQSVGRIIEKLQALNLLENTIIVFTSDNGGHGRITSNWPWRGNKGNFYEGGIRVPLIVQWPGHIPAGEQSDLPVMSTDYYPTLLELTGLPLRPEQHKDGMSFASLLLNDDKSESDSLASRTMYWHLPNYIANHPDAARPSSIIRQGDWKMIEWLEDGSTELYNLKDDPKESQNLSTELPGKVLALKKDLHQWRTEAQVQMPLPNPDFQP